MSDVETQPRTTNIRKAAWEEAQRSKGVLNTLLLIGVIGNTALILFLSGVALEALLLPWVPLVGWALYLISEARTRFWKDFAKEYGWKYQDGKTIKNEKALIFDLGHSKSIGHSVAGEHGGVLTRIFEYQFTVGSGKHKTTYHYTAFGFRFSGRFPHCYLNHLDAGYDVTGEGTRIPLPYTFEKQFHLYAPREYELEALEIFTPEILQFFLDEVWAFDIELVDQELLVLWKARVNTREELTETFEKSQRLVQKMAPLLNRVSFEPIGDHPYIMGA